MLHVIGGSATPLHVGLSVGVCQGDIAGVTKLLTEVIHDVAHIPCRRRIMSRCAGREWPGRNEETRSDMDSQDHSRVHPVKVERARRQIHRESQIATRQGWTTYCADRDHEPVTRGSREKSGTERYPRD
jgi:hypothetical protein